MKVLVATARMQGLRADDYNWCVEGELLWIQEPCDTDRRDPEMPCGCGRGFAGMNSHRGTTTALVADLPGMGRDGVVMALRSSLWQQGWPTSWAEDVADDMILLAEHWAPGTIVERHLDEFGSRDVA